MKCQIQIPLAFLAVLLSIAPAKADDPASALCDRGGGASKLDRVRNAISFWNSIDQSPSMVATLTAADEECVAGKIDEVSPEISAYCGARAEAGHDLVVRELDSLDMKLRELSFACYKIRSEARDAKVRQVIPKTCDDLIRSFQALANLMDEPANPEPELASCFRHNVSLSGASVVQMCADGTLSIQSSWHEISIRINRICRPADGAK